MKKYSNFQKLMLADTCSIFVGFISSLIYRWNDLLIFSIISQVCFASALILNVIALLLKRNSKNASDVVTSKDKIFIGLAVVCSLLLIIVLIILAQYILNN